MYTDFEVRQAVHAALAVLVAQRHQKRYRILNGNRLAYEIIEQLRTREEVKARRPRLALPDRAERRGHSPRAGRTSPLIPSVIIRKET